PAHRVFGLEAVEFFEGLPFGGGVYDPSSHLAFLIVTEEESGTPFAVFSLVNRPFTVSATGFSSCFLFVAHVRCDPSGVQNKADSPPPWLRPHRYLPPASPTGAACPLRDLG